MTSEIEAGAHTGGVWGVVAAVVALLWKGLPLLRQLVEEMRARRLQKAAELEQQKRRDRRRRREASSPPPNPRGPNKMPSVDPDAFDREESTDIDICTEAVLARETKRPRGERAPRPGTHHDRED